MFAEIPEAKRKIRSPGSLTEESLGLMPLSNEVLFIIYLLTYDGGFFSALHISLIFII